MLRSERVHDVMQADEAVVSWSDSADAALGRMRGLGCDRLAVVDHDGVIGLCERSALLAEQQRGGWLGSISVADLMRRGPFWCREDDSHDEVLRAMERLGTDTLAVLDRHGRVIGTVRRDRLQAAHPEPRARLRAGPRH